MMGLANYNCDSCHFEDDLLQGISFLFFVFIQHHTRYMKDAVRIDYPCIAETGTLMVPEVIQNAQAQLQSRI